MKRTIWIFFLAICATVCFGGLEAHKCSNYNNKNIVIDSVKIQLDDYPGSFNPSLIKTDDGLLLIFRYIPDLSKLHISRIGAMVLDESLKRITDPVLLDTRMIGSAPSQSEDSRIFSVNGEMYLIFTDNLSVVNPTNMQRRDMYLCKLHYVNGEFFAGLPVCLYHSTEYEKVKWQKNWVGFDWQGNLLLCYAPHPHEILYPNLRTGECVSIYKSNPKLKWDWGTMRGGTPPILVDGEYLAFFHSAIVTSSISSNRKKMWHYFMGAYTFSAEPPFALTSISPAPIVGENFYTYSGYEKRVVFPGGCVDCGEYLLVAFGKDDCEVWITKINKARLLESMVPVAEAQNR